MEAPIDVQVKLIFRSTGFCGGRKTGETGGKPENPEKNPHNAFWMFHTGKSPLLRCQVPTILDVGTRKFCTESLQTPRSRSRNKEAKKTDTWESWDQ